MMKTGIQKINKTRKQKPTHIKIYEDHLPY